MKAKPFLLIALLVVQSTAFGQTLFTYGKYKANAADFLRAYKKNMQAGVVEKPGAMREYLDLYINSRLKIQEAYARHYDTLPQIETEVVNLRAQMMDNYMNDPKAMDRLITEAFSRSQEDIHVAHIFAGFAQKEGRIDTMAAFKKINDALAALKKNEEFSAVAKQYSDDPSAKNNGGDLGMITVFTLPYEFENIIYHTKPGQYSGIYRSKSGYHIFKNVATRKSAGKIKAQQILLAYPPGISDGEKAKLGLLADSLYQQLQRGSDFSTLAAKYSNDYISANANGNMPEIGIGQFDGPFENALWSLKKDGDISKPFVTNHGVHIVKRISWRPIESDEKNQEYRDDLRQKIMIDKRWESAQDFIYPLVIKKAGFKKLPYNPASLWAYSDSMIEYKIGNPIAKEIKESTPLFKIGDSTLTAKEWINYAQIFRYKADRSGVKTYPVLLDEFEKASIVAYYRAHLEQFNDDFRAQMNDFKDGNLFFEIMQQEVWNKTPDSITIASIYNKNKSQYNWKPSAEAVMFYCSDEASAKSIMEQLKKNPSEWRRVTTALAEKVVADSSRFEWDQLPGYNKQAPVAGTVTSPVTNTGDNSVSFAYIVAVHPQPLSRSLAEAKGLVINDYQSQLEKTWIAQLRKKYPVKVDEKVFSKLTTK